MAKRRAGKGARKKRAVLEILGVILVLVCGFITVAPQLNLPFSVPTWQEIFSSAKLTELSEAAKQPLSVHYLDVGQGDSILIKSNGLNVLIQTSSCRDWHKRIRLPQKYMRIFCKLLKLPARG